MSEKKAKVTEPIHSPEELFEVMGEQIDRAITLCVRPRYNWGATPQLWEAGFKKAGRPLTLLAAEKLMEVLNPGDTVLLSTGWPIPPIYPEGEICGLAGVATLSRSLSIAFGTRSVIVAEEPSFGPLAAVAQAAELRVWDYDVLMERPAPFGTALYDFPIDDEAAKEEAKKLLDETGAKAVITVEKNDANEKGVHHSGLGEDMGPYTAHVEHLVNEANARGILTIGIGDVGNEIGFGLIHEEACEIIKPYGKQCNCGCGGGIIGATLTDCLVVASASNKGCYGIAACLAALTNNPKVLHDLDLQLQMMNAARDYPVYDSLTIRNTFTEDGAPGELTLGLFKTLRWLTEIPRWQNPFFEQARMDTGW